MDFDEYQKIAATTDTFDSTENKQVLSAGFITKIMGLAGESGEVIEKFKKVLRDEEGAISEMDKAEIVKELGDVLWYVSSIARYLDVPMSEVAKKNIAKLASRRDRNMLHGAGDNR